jgi:chromate transporter
VVEDERLHRFLEGVAAGVVGLIAITAVQLTWNVGHSIPSLAVGGAIFAAALALLYWWKSKLNVPAVVIASAAAGAALLS